MRIEYLNDIYQSSYRRGHLTETALLKVHSDIAEALDERSMTALIMLHLSPAFDVIDHSITTEAFRILFWNQGKSFNLGTVVLRRQNSVWFSGQ